jgi:hypothetical protein
VAAFVTAIDVVRRDCVQLEVVNLVVTFTPERAALWCVRNQCFGAESVGLNAELCVATFCGNWQWNEQSDSRATVGFEDRQIGGFGSTEFTPTGRQG